MATERIQSFADFWPYYLGEHQDPKCRALHYVGTTLAIGWLSTALLTLNPWLLIPAALSGYAFAWTGHFFIEKNKPATLTYPLWSLGADFRMYFLFLRGRIRSEVARYHPSTAPAAK